MDQHDGFAFVEVFRGGFVCVCVCMCVCFFCLVVWLVMVDWNVGFCLSIFLLSSHRSGFCECLLSSHRSRFCDCLLSSHQSRFCCFVIWKRKGLCRFFFFFSCGGFWLPQWRLMLVLLWQRWLWLLLLDFVEIVFILF